MPTPTFDDLLKQAQAIGERRDREGDFNRGEMMAKSITQSVSNLFLGKPKGEEYVGRINPASGEIESFDSPRYTTRSLMDRIMGAQKYEPKAGTIPFGQDEGAKFAFEKALLTGKPKTGSSLSGEVPSDLLDEVNMQRKTNFQKGITWEQLNLALGTDVMDWDKKEVYSTGFFGKPRFPPGGGGPRDEKLGKAAIDYTNKINSDWLLRKLKEKEVTFDSLNQLNTLVRTGNTVAAAAMGPMQAKGLGDAGTLSKQDVTMYVESGMLSQKAGDILLMWLTGSKTEATLNDLYQINEVLKDVAKRNIQPIYNHHVKVFAINNKISKEEAAERLDIPYVENLDKQLKDSPIRKVAGGGSVGEVLVKPAGMSQAEWDEYQTLKKEFQSPK